jgi:phosphate-selective porin OprO and OprP
MPLATQSTTIALAMVMTFVGSQVRAQSANSTAAEIAALKKQLRLMEEKLDGLQKQTAAKTVAAAKANAKTEANAKVTADDANGVVSVKALPPRPDAIVKMPNNRPTICTADEQNCIALTSRLDFDAGGYDYRPNTANTKPQRLDDGVNARPNRRAG